MQLHDVRGVSLKVDVTTRGVPRSHADLSTRPRPDLSQVPVGNGANTDTDTFLRQSNRGINDVLRTASIAQVSHSNYEGASIDRCFKWRDRCFRRPSAAGKHKLIVCTTLCRTLHIFLVFRMLSKEDVRHGQMVGRF